ncbi:MAG: hypothetical protein M9897_11685 [Brumimicrobium sp.]|nr:hypothetical protein [Brumimicrobium sp.]
MKRFLIGFVAVALILSTQMNNAQAQAFKKGDLALSLDFVGSSMFNINHWSSYSSTYGYAPTWRSSTNGGLNVYGEWAIHDYVSLGFIVGIQGGRYGWGTGYYGNPYGYGYAYGGYGMISAPIGIKADFHFYQFIADKKGKDIHADKLDIYAGINVGSGISYVFEPGWFNVLFFVGPEVGARYYFTDKIGVNLELGYGKSFVSGGVVFKM